MRLLASLPAHLAVIALLAWLALRMLAAAEKKGRSGPRWLFVFFTLWLGTLGLAAFGARFGYERHFHTRPGFWPIYGPAAACAFGTVIALRWVLGRKSALSTADTAAPKRTEPRPTPPLPPTPLPQPSPVHDEPRPTPPLAPTPLPKPAPPAEPAVFKFACPHCGQRLAVTTAEVGTVANCPNCETPIEVPAPSSA